MSFYELHRPEFGIVYAAAVTILIAGYLLRHWRRLRDGLAALARRFMS